MQTWAAGLNKGAPPPASPRPNTPHYHVARKRPSATCGLHMQTRGRTAPGKSRSVAWRLLPSTCPLPCDLASPRPNTPHYHVARKRPSATCGLHMQTRGRTAPGKSRSVAWRLLPSTCPLPCDLASPRPNTPHYPFRALRPVAWGPVPPFATGTSRANGAVAP